MYLYSYSCWDLYHLGTFFMVAFQPDPSLTYFKNLFCPISVVYFVTSSVAAETKQGWGSSSGGTRKFVLEIPYVNYNFKVLLLVVKFTVFERKCTLFLCELPTASKNPNFSCLNYYIYIYGGFFFFFSCFALLLMQPLQCCAAADRAGLIRSTHVMMLRAISIPILALCVSRCSDNAWGCY